MGGFQQAACELVELVWPPVVVAGQATSVEVQHCTSLVAPPGKGLQDTARLQPVEGAPLKRRRSSAIRVSERDLGVLTLVLGDAVGNAPPPARSVTAPLPILPAAACDELKELLWRMVCEALPASMLQPAFDPDAFTSPVHLLPPAFRHVLCWAWSTHFLPLALDLQYCLTCVPDATGADNADADEAAQYLAVLTPLAAFLRDHECCVVLGLLLRACTAHGLEVVSDAETLAALRLRRPGSPPTIQREGSASPTPALPADCPALQLQRTHDHAATSLADGITTSPVLRLLPLLVLLFIIVGCTPGALRHAALATALPVLLGAGLSAAHGVMAGETCSHFTARLMCCGCMLCALLGQATLRVVHRWA